MRQGAELALDFVFPRPPLAQALGDRCVGFLWPRPAADELGISRGERIGFIALVFQRVKRMRFNSASSVVEARGR